MNSYERVLNTFTGHTVDKIPVFHIGFSSQAASMLLGREAYIGGGIQQWREATALCNGDEAHAEFLERSYQDAFEIAGKCNMDIIRPSYWRLPIKPVKRLNEYEFLYGNDDNWCIRRYQPDTEVFDVVKSHPPQQEMTFEDLEQFLKKWEQKIEEYDPSIPGNYKALKNAIKAFGNEKVIRVDAAKIEIPMEPLWLEATCLRPDLVKRYLDIQVKKSFKEIIYLATLGVKFIFGGGDMASNTGPLYSPRIFRELMFPSVKMIADECHRLNMIFLFNSDGNLWPVSDDLFGKSGVDGYYEIDRSAGMDIEKLRLKYPMLNLLGNISSQTLHTGSRDDVVKETLACLKVAHTYGRIVVGCSNYLVPGTPIENSLAMIDTIEKYR